MKYKVMITIIREYDGKLYDDKGEALEAAALAANETIVDEVWIEEVEEVEQLPPVTQKSGKWINVNDMLPIPDNATNGDVVKTLFSNTFDNFCERTTWEWNRWWNSPYQKGGKK